MTKGTFILISFKNGSTLASFIVYFQSFQTNIITIFTTNTCEKCPFSIQCWDSNPRPSEHESPSISTRSLTIEQRPMYLICCFC